MRLLSGQSSRSRGALHAATTASTSSFSSLHLYHLRLPFERRIDCVERNSSSSARMYSINRVSSVHCDHASNFMPRRTLGGHRPVLAAICRYNVKSSILMNRSLKCILLFLYLPILSSCYSVSDTGRLRVAVSCSKCHSTSS